MSHDYPPWTDVITAFAVQMLTAHGFHEGSMWDVHPTNNPHPHLGGLKKAIDFLCEHQHATGRWGEDSFDTCQVLKALIPFAPRLGLSEFVDRGVAYLREQITSGWEVERNGEWHGPGFYACTVEVLNILGEQEAVSSLIEQLYLYQNLETGRFCGSDVTSDTDASDLCYWHTALTVLAMHSLGIPASAQRLAQAVRWLEARQNDDGSWGTSLFRHRAIYTGYGILAISSIKGAGSPHVKLGLEWLVQHQSDDGRVGGLEGTIMAGLAMSRLFPLDIAIQIPLNVLIDVQRLLKEQSDTINQQVSRISEYQASLDAANAVIRAKEDHIHQLEAKSYQEGQRISGVLDQIMELQSSNDADRYNNKGRSVPSTTSIIIVLVVAVLILFAIKLLDTSTSSPEDQSSPASTPTNIERE